MKNKNHLNLIKRSLLIPLLCFQFSISLPQDKIITFKGDTLSGTLNGKESFINSFYYTTSFTVKNEFDSARVEKEDISEVILNGSVSFVFIDNQLTRSIFNGQKIALNEGIKTTNYPSTLTISQASNIVMPNTLVKDLTVYYIDKKGESLEKIDAAHFRKKLYRIVSDCAIVKSYVDNRKNFTFRNVPFIIKKYNEYCDD